MTRRINIFTTAAVALSCALPVSGAMAMQNLHPSETGEGSQESAPTYRDLRSPDARDAARDTSPVQVTYRDLRSPDARDAARDVAPTQVSYRDLRSPDARDAALNPAPVVTTVAAEPADGFDFGDAGIGAAALLGLFGLGFGSTLIVTKGRRQQGLTAH